MFPKECESCGLKTDELVERSHIKDKRLNWFICKYCEGKLYQHEFDPHPAWSDLCVHCGKKFEDDIHC